MEWTREQRYRALHEASIEELNELKERVNNCPWRQTFHIQPTTGLLNDPNGFSFYNGEYHLFYQWFPLGPVHGLKYWYHTKSKDLVHWENVGIGIEPKDFYDRHGAYSGSGIEHNGKLYLFYTGNTRDQQWVRQPYQCQAIMDEHLQIRKSDLPIIPNVPEGYTDHYRDPKVWKDGDVFYMLIGAQRIDKTGCVVLYSSKNLSDWDFEGEIKTTLKDFGYMWECPDYFELNDHGILIFSPQGIRPADDFYQNIYQSGYLLGEKLDMKQKSLNHDVFIELDRGFDFYAPQTMVDDQNRRILVGWMGLPEIEYPTERNGWVHCLTLPRELSVVDGKLIQQPVKELQLLRKNEERMEDTISHETKMYRLFSGTTYELICEFSQMDATEFGIEFRASEEEKTILKYDTTQKKVILDRTYSGESFGEEYGTERACVINSDKIKFHMFVDISSVEIFINNGEEVFTSRIFPKNESNEIRFFANEGSVSFKTVKWDY